MIYEEKCPICGSADYEIEDYQECFDDVGCSQWWICRCPNGHSFCMEKVYKLTNVVIAPEENENEEVL